MAIHRVCADCGRPLHDDTDVVFTERTVTTTDAAGNDCEETVWVTVCEACWEKEYTLDPIPA